MVLFFSGLQIFKRLVASFLGVTELGFENLAFTKTLIRTGLKPNRTVGPKG